MTKEELVNEAEEYVKQNYCDMCVMADDCKCGCIDCFTVQAYLASAEPREKRIAELEDKLANADYQLEGRDVKIKELEKENAELKETCNKWFEHLKNREEELLNELNNQNVKYNKQIAELEKENAELKEKVNILDNCDRLGDVITEAYKDQLTKAKELMKEFVHHYKAKTIYIENMQDLLEQAEQFLKDSEVENDN